MHMFKFINSCIVSRNIRSRGYIKRNNMSNLFSAPRMPKKSNKTHKNFCSQETNPSVCSVHLDVIGSGAYGVPGSVVLVTNYGSYLINCGEGTLKLANEYKVKIHKSLNVFITYANWNNIAGLMGLALSTEQAGGTKLDIHGDRGIGNMFSAIKTFVNLRHLQVTVQSCAHYEEFSDGTVTAKYVFLYPSIKRNLSNSENEKSDIKSKPPQNSPFMKTKEQNQVESLQHLRKSTQYAISYIFRTKGSQGHLNFQKCLEYGVPAGPLLGQLKNGNDVTLSNGKVVRSEDVKDPNLPGLNIIAVQCPTEDYLDSLLEEPSFHEFQSVKNPADAIVHFTSSKLVKNIKYQMWISRFPKTTLHLFINEDNKRTGSVAIHRQQYKLNLLQPDIFPILDDSGIPDFPRAKNSDAQNGHSVVEKSIDKPVAGLPIYKDKVFFNCNNNPFINGETLCQVPLKPKRNYDYSNCLVLRKETFFNEMFESDEIKTKIEECKNVIKEIQKTTESDNRIYPKIVFLGTGSSKPSKIRNASGILIWLSSSKCILLDCGEFTYGQLVNFYGLQKTKEVLRSVQSIYISHMHLDHHLGLITILKERKNAFDELDESSSEESNVETTAEVLSNKFSPVYILAPEKMRHWLTMISDTFEDISKLHIFIPNTHMLMKNDKLKNEFEECKKSLDLKSLMTVHVYHCPSSFGISIVHNEGWKITYSGDTKPCPALVDIGMDSDILIHEATLEDAYIQEARMKHHSTTTQAIDIGKAMNAKFILLTHFSQRYCHLPNIDSSFSNLNIGIAFDFMEVPFNKLPLLPALIEPLQYSLSKYDERNKTTTQLFLLKREKMGGAQAILKQGLQNFSETPAKVFKSN